MLDDVRVFQQFREEYEGELSPQEQLRLKYQAMVAADPDMIDRIRALPVGIASAKVGKPSGVFVCQLRPTLVGADDAGEGPGEWSVEPGTVDWAGCRKGRWAGPLTWGFVLA